MFFPFGWVYLGVLYKSELTRCPQGTAIELKALGTRVPLAD